MNEIYVLARRSDGASSGRRTGRDGKFELPVGAGEWQLQAIRGSYEGDTIKLQISEGQIIDAIELELP